MAMFRRIRAVFIFSVVALFTHETSADVLDNFNLVRIACETHCECYAYSSTAKDTSQVDDSFSVKCIGWRIGFLQGLTLPPIKSNTTDFVYKDSDWGLNYKLDTRLSKIDTTDQNPKSLVLRHRSITYVSYNTFNLYSMRLLHHVDLNFNMIEELHANTFTFQSNLKTISVANNNIGRVARHAFKNLYKLEQINLSHNSLKTLNFNMLLNVPSLRILDFSYNKLTTLPQTVMNVRNIEILDLSYNRLDNLPWDSLSQLLFLEKLGLRGNPWRCTCQMKDILKVNRTLLVGSQAVCQTPYRLRGVLLENLNSHTFSYCSKTRLKEDILLLIPLVYQTRAGTFTTNPFLAFLLLIYGEILKYYFLGPSVPRIVLLGQIVYNNKKYISCRNRKAFKGNLKDGREAWIKVYQVSVPVKEIREMKMLLLLLKRARPHPSIIQYLCWEQDTTFTYVAFELCVENLKTAVMRGNFGFGDISIAELQIYFRQLASGISFLHENGIQHGNIRPKNILCKKTCSGISLVISNFKWSSDEQHCLKIVDIRSLGHVFYFMFAKEEIIGMSRVRGLLSDARAALHKHFWPEEQIASVATDLVYKMLRSDSLSQMKAHQIEEQPFLWSNKEKMDFFHRVGKLMQDKDDPKVIRFKKELEQGASKIFDGNWMTKLDPVVQSDVHGFAKVKKSVCGLLRVIRNKIEHFEGIRSPKLRNIYMGSPDGVVEYYMRCFPKLLVYTYTIIEKNRLALIKKK